MITICLFILSVHGSVLNNSTTAAPDTNEPFENENLLRIALEKHIQEGNHLLFCRKTGANMGWTSVEYGQTK